MPRNLYEIAHDAALDVVNVAQCAGYEICDTRHIPALTGEIYRWLRDVARYPDTTPDDEP